MAQAAVALAGSVLFVAGSGALLTFYMNASRAGGPRRALRCAGLDDELREALTPAMTGALVRSGMGTAVGPAFVPIGEVKSGPPQVTGAMSDVDGAPSLHVPEGELVTP